MEFQRRDTDWPVYGTSTETCGTDLMTDIEDGGVDQMSMMQPANDDIAILDENIGSSVDCYDTSNCGIGVNFVRIGGEDFRPDNWMSNATTKNDYHPDLDVANFETEQPKILADSSSMEYDAADRYPGAHSYNASAGLMDSSPAQKSQAIETAVGADMNSEEDTSHAAFTEKYASSSSSSQGKEREICNWKEVTESNSLNISTHDSDMGTGYGDGDVEDAYHAIFGEEKKCTKGQRGSNISTEPSPTSGSCCNVDNVLDAAAAALSGSKRDRKGRPLEVKKEDDSSVLSKTVKNGISSFSVGKVVIITSGEYCDWEGEILCIETSQSYPKSSSKSKQSEAFYVVALQYSDGSPLDCCVLVSHSMITSTKLCSSNEEQLDDISDDSDMADSTMKYTANSHCSTAPLTLDFPPKPPKLSFQISPIRPGRNHKLTDKDKDKSNNEKGDIYNCDKFFSEECIEIVEAFTADLVQSQVNSETVISVLNEIKTNIEIENKDQIKNGKIHKNDMNKNSAGRKGVNDSMCEKDIESREIVQNIPDDVKIDLDVTDKCESSRNDYFLTNEEKEIFQREGIVHAEEKAEHEKLKTEEKVGISNFKDTATKGDSGTKKEIGSVDSAEVAVAVEEVEIVTDTAITGEIMVTHGDEVSGGSNSGLAVLSEISANIDNERNGLIFNSVILTRSTGAESVRDNDGDNSHSNDNTICISNSNRNSMDENDSDAPLQPLSSSQIRYQQYAALRPLDMSTVGRRVRITAAGNKHRTRYGTVVSVVDLTHYLISVTFVSPFQHKSPKSKNGDSCSQGPSSCCVCLYLSVEDFNFVD